MHRLFKQNTRKDFSYTFITKGVESVKLKQSVAQKFLQKLQNAYLELPREFEIYKLLEKHNLPIIILMISNQRILS